MAQAAVGPRPMQAVHGSVFDATDGVTPIAGGQVTPVYDCADACDMSQAIPGADSTQTVALADGQFLFLQSNARLTGYYIAVPGYQPLFVPRSFRNPAAPAVYGPAAVDGGMPEDEDEDEEPTDPGGTWPENPPDAEPVPEEEMPGDEPTPTGEEQPLDAGTWPEQELPAGDGPQIDDMPGPGTETQEVDASTLDPGAEQPATDGGLDAGALATADQAEAVMDAGRLGTDDLGEAILDAGMLGTLEQASDASTLGSDGAVPSPDGGAPIADAELPPVFLCPEAATDTDHDGVCDIAEMKYTTDPSNADSDGDFLSDASELYGYRTDDGKLLDLPALKASPKHRDVFLYVDYYPGLAPAQSALNQVVSAFAGGAWDNLDGKPGVALHVKRAAKAITSADAKSVIGFPELGALKGKYFDKTLTYAYHYVVFANRVQSKTSKVSGLSPDTEAAADFIVSLGGWTPRGGTALQQAGTLMHELGHNLGLDHGGYTFASETPGGQVVSDTTSYKPHYLSVMNYNYQTYGMQRGGKRVIDYARHAVGALAENALSEAAALKAPDPQSLAGLGAYKNLRICKSLVEDYCERFAVIRRGTAAAELDWNRNRKTDPGLVQVDLNGANGTNDSWKGIAGDWALLKYNGLPRTGERAGSVELADVHARTCMSQPQVEEEPEAP